MKKNIYKDFPSRKLQKAPPSKDRIIAVVIMLVLLVVLITIAL